MLEGFIARTFSECLGDVFLIHCGGAEPLEAELASVVGSGGEGSDGRPFSVVFRGPEDASLSQGIHRVEHEVIGGFELFLVPIGPDGGGLLYEAVFN